MQSIEPVGLNWLTSRWRRYALKFDPTHRTVIWSTRRGVQRFAVADSTAGEPLPVLKSLVVVTYRGSKSMGRMFLLLDERGALLGRSPKTFLNLFDRTWPAANLGIIRSWGVDLIDDETGTLMDLQRKYPGAAPEAPYVRTWVISLATAVLIPLGVVIVLAVGTLLGH